MKKLLSLGLLLIRLPASAIETGASRDAVLAELGEPSGIMQRDGNEILLYPTGTVTLQNGSVVAADLSQDYVRQAEERAVQAKKNQAAKQAELEKQKQLYPEDRVVRIGCSYSKNENWESLPELIRPAQGAYGYDVYIPQGYHESDKRRYTCLFLESPALWDSVAERLRNEKWMAVILHDVTGQQIGKALNGNFLAAFDDAVERFRIDKEKIFIAGRVPPAIFAIMRPVAGIILHEPDFRGYEQISFSPDFLRQNPRLRAFVLLSKTNPDNMHYQAQFIMARIPNRHIGVYDGNAAILPKGFADDALDWMKKEYRIP
jgi:hypothetical protein